MSKFKKKKSGELPPVSTASLPDIVFMLLFFFMTVTQMRDTTIMVKNVFPEASEIQALDKKDPVIYIYVGSPLQQYQGIYGATARIQLNDRFASVDEVGDYILETKTTDFRQDQQNLVIVALKIDEKANMGLVSDIKQKLRDVNALKINYITNKPQDL